MKRLLLILLTVLVLPVFGQVSWREATTAEVAAGTIGVPAAITPRRLAGQYATGNTLWVDPVNGSDSTAVRGGVPSVTIGNAIRLSHSGDLIHVRPGTYNENNLLRSNLVNFYFDPGAKVIYRGATDMTGIFSDSQQSGANYVTGPGTTNTITGHGTFTYAATNDQSTISPDAVMRITSTNSVVYFEGDLIDQNNYTDGSGNWIGGGGIVVSFCKYVNIHFKTISVIDDGSVVNIAQGQGCIDWLSGQMDAEVDNMVSSNMFNVSIDDHAGYPIETSFRLRAKNIREYGSGNAIWTYGGGGTPQLQRVWIEAEEIRANTGAVFQNEIGGGDKIYITAQKLSNASSSHPVLELLTSSGQSRVGFLWVTAQKITDNIGGGIFNLNETSVAAAIANTNYSVYLNVQQYECLSPNFVREIQANGGQVWINPGSMIVSNGLGIYQSVTGSVFCTGLSIDTSTGNSGVTNAAIFKLGGNLTINGCVLTSPSSAHALDATNTQPVRFNFTSVTSSTNFITPTGVWYSNATLFVGGTSK